MNRKRTPLFTPSTSDFIEARALSKLIDNYLLICDIERQSDRTLENRRWRLSMLRRHSERVGWDEIGVEELRRFFHHLGSGHKEPDGRFGNPRLRKELAPGTIKSFYQTYRTFFNWLVEEGEIGESPMERVPSPIDRPDEIKPFTEEECERMLQAATKTRNNRRDEAILCLLLDCGLRASELTGLRPDDIDFQARHITVKGKGGKKRFVPFSNDARRTLYNYMKEAVREPDECLFMSERGVGSGGELTRVGLRLVIVRIAEAAGVKDAHPHRFRHTFAVLFLRSGGNEFSLQTMLGHTSLVMTRRYVMLCQADVARAHQQFSPLARVKGKRS